MHTHMHPWKHDCKYFKITPEHESITDLPDVLRSVLQLLPDVNMDAHACYCGEKRCVGGTNAIAITINVCFGLLIYNCYQMLYYVMF